MESSIPILVSDMESINQRIYNITRESIPAQGIWCKDDGCVFKTVFCPFCANPNNCLGVEVMAADASNVQFLIKILFYSDSLLIKAAETSTMVSSSSSLVPHYHFTIAVKFIL
nr:Fanconi anemia group J protein homolog [Ipomoea batatas]